MAVMSGSQVSLVSENQGAALLADAPRCHCCGSGVVDLGPLPALDPHRFSGRASHANLQAGRMWRCRRCDLRFRYPYLSQSELTELYKDLPPTIWESSGTRRVWREILADCERRRIRKSIVDVGCFNGDFLAWLPPEWEKRGIEPALAARRVAESRGIEIIGEAIGAPVSLPDKPAVVTLIDVLEHMENPLAAVRYIGDLLGAGGLAFIFTGAADSAAWRLLRNDYWYSSLPEHVSFLTRNWFEYAAAQTGMRLRAYRRMSSAPFSPALFCFNFARISLYTAVQRARRRGWPEQSLRALPFLRRVAEWKSVPWWKEAGDHCLVVLEPIVRRSR
jgi:SAM-dependent methyltransferase